MAKISGGLSFFNEQGLKVDGIRAEFNQIERNSSKVIGMISSALAGLIKNLGVVYIKGRISEGKLIIEETHPDLDGKTLGDVDYDTDATSFKLFRDCYDEKQWDDD